MGEKNEPKQEYCRVGSTRDYFFPEDRASKLDREYLTKQGLTKKRMQEKDAFFFLNLLLPVCDPAKSNIADDPRLPYYTSVANFTNLYALGKLEWNGSYGRKFSPSIPEEHVHLDGIVSRNKNDQLMDNWDINHTKNYDQLIAETMGVRRVLNLKRALKLCPYFSEKKRTDVGYDPCQKYRLIWDVFTHNTLCSSETKRIKRGKQPNVQIQRRHLEENGN